MRPILATTVADRKGRLIAKACALAPVISELFSGVSAFATTRTHPELVQVLDSVGASIERANSDSNLKESRWGVELVLTTFRQFV